MTGLKNTSLRSQHERIAEVIGERTGVYKAIPIFMIDILIALGGNLAGHGNDIRSTLTIAVERLDNRDEFSVRALSDWYQTPAWPPGSGPEFLNAAAHLRSSLPPGEILAQLHVLERELGRERPARWAPRICDLDLLAGGDLILPDPGTVARWMDLTQEEAARETPGELILPHPRLHERAFVLVPLAGIAPDWRHPILGKTTLEMLADLAEDDVAAIRPLRA